MSNPFKEAFDVLAADPVEDWMEPRVVALVQAIHRRYPKFQIKYKDESRVWRMMPKNLRNAATTTGKTVWYSSRKKAKRNQKAFFRTLAHESRHMSQYHSTRWRFFTRYFFPQCTCGLFLVAALVLLLLGHGLWAAVVGGAGLLHLLPWPAPFRLRFEIDGYTMSMACQYWEHGRITEGMKRMTARVLCGWLYYKMVWSRRRADLCAWSMATGFKIGILPPGSKDQFTEVREIIERYR